MRLRIFAVAVLVAATSLVAQAGTITPDFPTPFGSGSAYKYSFSLGSGETFYAGDFFTLYDFSPLAGYTSISESGMLPGFTLDIEYTLTPATGVIVTDDPNLLDIRFTYTGNTVLTAGDIGTFTVFTPYGLDYHLVSTDLSENGGATRMVGFGIAPNVPAVPEPGSLALLGSGFVGALGVIRRKLKL